MSQKIKLIYTPEGGSRREWVVDLARPAWDITFATEKATDWPWGVFVERIQNQSAIALRALLWVLRKRDEPRLQLDSMTIDLDELDFAGQCPSCEEWVSDEVDAEAHLRCGVDDNADTAETGSASGAQESGEA